MCPSLLVAGTITHPPFKIVSFATAGIALCLFLCSNNTCVVLYPSHKRLLFPCPRLHLRSARALVLVLPWQRPAFAMKELILRTTRVCTINGGADRTIANDLCPSTAGHPFIHRRKHHSTRTLDTRTELADACTLKHVGGGSHHGQTHIPLRGVRHAHTSLPWPPHLHE